MAWPVNLTAKQVLVREGEESQSMYLVQDGELLVTKMNDTGETILGVIRAGELVGELSYLDQKPRSATVTAITDCKLIQIPRKTIEEVLTSQPPWIAALIQSLTQKIREADKKIRI